ncbi:hypothetical protein AN189_12840 [Loktanella sp. 3ANDIMAR09]|uniref:MFS transporter n=1 Tax=Loktanella gaetbuli TaxID=2881335 RepID=A0ABS8BSX1_9RHOB|nr:MULTISPECIES: MFS transporter [Loktanella]KQI67961.1 hypothetical protein AN189_12840 [Loktanella sp. 3ANDIMAR09]MCB5198825.1 MFS transporter [Loktanella gaetbuli]
MTEAGAGRRLIGVLSVANFAIGMGAFVLIGMLVPVGDSFGISPGRTGWLMTTYALSYAVLSPLLVSATGRIGRRRILTIAMAIFALAHVASAVAPTEFTLHLTRIIAAAGAGMFTPVSASVAARLSTPQTQGKTLAWVVFGLTLAQVLGVPAGSFIAYTFGWRAAMLIVAVLALAMLPLLWRIVPRGLNFQPVSLRELGAILRNGPMMLAVTFTATFLAAVYVVYTYFAPLMENGMGYGRDGITALLLMFGVGAVLGNLMGGWMADRIGPTRTLTILCIAQIALLPLFSLLPLPGIVLALLVAVWSATGWSFLAGQQMRIIALRIQAAPVLLALNAAAIYIGAALGSAVGSGAIALGGLMALGVTGGLLGLLALGHITLSRRISG